MSKKLNIMLVILLVLLMVLAGCDNLIGDSGGESSSTLLVKVDQEAEVTVRGQGDTHTKSGTNLDFDNLQNGNYTVEVYKENYKFETQDIYLDSDQVLSFELLEVNNLVEGFPIEMNMDIFDQDVYDSEMEKLPRLVDNELGEGDWEDGRDKYVDFYRGMGRELIIDLEEDMTISELNIRVMFDHSAGIYETEEVSFFLSDDDGQSWSNIGSVEDSDALEIDDKHILFQMNKINYGANQLKIKFPVDVWAFVDELQVIGLDYLSEDAWDLADNNDDDNSNIVNAWPEPGSEQVGGTYHDYLAYGGYHTNGTELHEKDLDLLLPAVAYLNDQGEVIDWLFDSFTFLPYISSSNDNLYVHEHDSDRDPATKSDWIEYLDYVFDTENQIAALDEATEMVKGELDDPDYKTKVKIAIPQPLPQQSDFGEINGKSLNFNHEEVGDEEAFENRVIAVKWYVDQVLERWSDANYGNLELLGFYWQSEAINNSISNKEEEILQELSKYIQDNDKLIYWIPYYLAPGFEDWAELGFDYAVMQPNHAFNESPDDRVTQTADVAKQYGLGVEMEMHHNVLNDESLRENFHRYLDQGLSTGVMEESVQAWYLANTTLNDLYDTSDPLYDKIYAYIKASYPEINVALNKPIEREIEPCEYTDNPEFPHVTEAQEQEIEDLPLLVDGDYGTSDFDDGKHVKFNWGERRRIYIDLESDTQISSINLFALEDEASGINLPEDVIFKISNDGGENWTDVGEVIAEDAYLLDEHHIYEVSDLDIEANQVLIDMDVNEAWAIVSEIEINISQ